MTSVVVLQKLRAFRAELNFIVFGFKLQVTSENLFTNIKQTGKYCASK